MISLLPCSTASSSGVSPSESFLFTSAFLSSSNSTISFLPRMIAWCKRGMFWSSFTLGSEPPFNRASAASRWPWITARRSGVQPYFSTLMFMFAAAIGALQHRLALGIHKVDLFGVLRQVRFDSFEIAQFSGLMNFRAVNGDAPPHDGHCQDRTPSAEADRNLIF